MRLLSKPKLPVFLTLMLFSLAGSGCAPKVDNLDRAATINKIMESWIGHYQSELIDKWGTPTKIMPDGKGGNIIIYESLKGTWGYQRDIHIVGGSHYTTSPRQSGYAAKRIFHVNEKGVIYFWKWSGL